MEESLVSWNPKFEIGITVIDEQHKCLVELCAELHKAVLDQKKSPEAWKQSMASALKTCIEYIKVHFLNEENLMLKINFPKYPVHKIRHDEFTKKILKTAKNFDTLDRAEAIRFVHFLYDWILSHIAHEDKMIAFYIDIYGITL